MRFNNIQLLRVLAAGGVILIHLPEYAARELGVPDSLGPLGRIGDRRAFPVPLFFAVSGFVLTHALHSAPPGRFLLARFLRLYPGYWLAVGLAVVAAWLTFCPPEFGWGERLTWLTHVGFSLTPRGPGKAVHPLTVEWSLVYEVVLSVALAGFGLLGVRRGVPVAAGLWLAVLAGKMIVRPGYGTDMSPTWGLILLSGYNVPFLLGVMAYYLRDRGRRWRWGVLAGLVAGVVALPHLAPTWEILWAVLGLLSAAAVWLSVQVRQVSAGNPVARLGDYTYGLYLLHVPVMMSGFYLLSTRGWLVGTVAGAWLVGAAAVVLGLLFGRVEAALHRRLRPLAKVNPGDVRAWVGRKVPAGVLRVVGRPAAAPRG